MDQDSWDYIWSEVYDAVENQCDGEVCEFFPLEGDPDLAGKGVSSRFTPFQS